MANDEVVKRLSTLAAAAIRTGRPGLWDDDTLLDVAHHFEEAGDDARRLATLELLLRSPELSEMLDYQDIYAMLYESLRHRGDFAASLRWLHAALAYVAQHDPETDLSSVERDLAETYLQAGDFDTGLALFTRLLHRNPKDPWIHNVLALTLPDEGLASLALEVLARGRSLVAVDDSAGLRAQFAELEEEATVAAAAESSRLSEIDPTVLQAFRAALQADAAAGDDPYLPPLDQLGSASADQLPALTAAILQEGKILAPELIRMASDPTLADTPALERALALLRQLQETDAVALDELAPWLAQADGHWLQTLHSPHIGKIGGITTAALEALVADTNYATYLRENAATALIERMSPEPNRNQRLLDLLRRLLTRAEASESAEEERFVTQLIDVIVDHKMVELYP
ncbi:MAG: tetratricopeptide repeat protein, partial [Caldilineaceae bacterium]|nr:tetratricopeptide repeat protein [Caldilineaceae bacterium]